MTEIEDRLSAAVYAAAATVADDSAPPLRLTGQPVRIRIPHRPARRGSRWSAFLAPVAAATAVIAVVGVWLAVGTAGSKPTAPSRRTAEDVLGPDGVPRYYVALIPAGKASSDDLVRSRFQAVVIDTVSGAVLARAAAAPGHYNTFVAVTGAADDRTFVLAAERTPRSGQSPITFFRATYDPGRRRITLATLPVPAIPAGTQLDGLALSPGGTRLAVSTGSSAHISIYSMATGAVSVWRQPHSTQTAYDLSFDGAGGLSYYQALSGIWLLNSNTAGGSLSSDSRLVARPPQRYRILPDALITPDGRTIVAALLRVSGRRIPSGWFATYSAATGKLTQVLWPTRTLSEGVLWTSPSGRVLVVFAPSRPHGAGAYDRFGVLKNDRFTRLPDRAPVAVAGSLDGLVPVLAF